MEPKPQTGRIATLDDLYPPFRDRLERLIEDLEQQGLPLRLFETMRSPWRQDELYARGRTAPGKRCTKARAWQSAHQYGRAADMVWHVDGQWTWEEPIEGGWGLYHDLARAVGLRPLSFERPHVELPGWHPNIQPNTLAAAWLRDWRANKNA